MTRWRPGEIEVDVVEVRAARRSQPGPPRFPLPWLFAAAMAGSTALAVFGGLVLGFLAATETGIGASHWTEVVQAHGRLQLFGWAGVFVVALTFEFLIRLNQRPPLPAAARAAVLLALASGAVIGVGAQVWHDVVGFLWLPGGALVAAAAAGNAALVFRVRAARPLSTDLHPLFFRAAASWFVVAAAMSVVSIARAADPVLPLAETAIASDLVVRGFLLNTIVAVGLRAFPGHLELEPVPVRRQAVIFAWLNGALAARVLVGGAYGLPANATVVEVADVAFGAGLVALTLWLRVLAPLRHPFRGPRYRVFVPLAWLGLVAYGAGVVGLAFETRDANATLYQVGAVRHILLTAFMAPLMVAMAHIVLERFGTGRLRFQGLLTAAFFMLVSAWPLRVLPVLFVGSPSEAGRAVLGTAAVLEAAGLAAMAVVAASNGLAIRAAHRLRGRTLP